MGGSGGGGAGGSGGSGGDAGFTAPALVEAHAFFAHLRDVTFGGGKFVAVGDLGTTAQSVDGLSWTYSFVNSGENLLAVTHFGTQFITTGDGGGIYTSPTANVWTPRASGVSGPLHGVAASATRAIAVGLKRVTTSTDGITWTASNFTPSNKDLMSIAWGGGNFAALAWGGGFSTIYSSTDGTGWTATSANFGNPVVRTVRYLGSRFVVAGQQKVADIGAAPPFTNVLQYSAGFDFSAVAGPATGTVAALGQWGHLATAVDGGAYTERPPASDGTLRGAAFGNGVYVAVGDDGQIIRSTDGVNWTDIANGVHHSYDDMAFGAGRFVTMGGNTGSSTRALTSTDGLSWTFGPRVGTHVRFSGNEFVVASHAGQFARSSDGLTYERVKTSATWNLSDATRGADKYVAVGGSGDVTYSFDGGAWVKADAGVGTVGLYRVDYLNGQYLASGVATLLTSPNGIVWTKRTLPGNPLETLQSFSYAAGIYGVTARLQTFTSVDGVTWNAHPQPAFNSDGKAFYDGTRFVMSRTQPSLFTSNDFVTWTQSDGGIEPSGGNRLEGGAFGAGLWAFGYGPNRVASTTNFSDFYVFNTQMNARVTGLWARPDGGFIASNEYGLMLSSDDGRTFAPKNAGFEMGFRHRQATSGATVVAGSEGRYVFTSLNNGSTWQKIAVAPAGEVVRAVAFAHGKFYAFANKLYTSPDGLVWTVGISAPFTAAASNGTRLVAASGNMLYRTDDGTTFTPATAPSATYRDITFADGLFVVVGNNGFVATSTDGATFSASTVPGTTTKDFNAVVKASNLWVAAGNAGLLYTSVDAGTWTTRAAPPVNLLSAAPAGTDVLVGGDKGLLMRVAP